MNVIVFFVSITLLVRFVRVPRNKTTELKEKSPHIQRGATVLRKVHMLVIV